MSRGGDGESWWSADPVRQHHESPGSWWGERADVPRNDAGSTGPLRCVGPADDPDKYVLRREVSSGAEGSVWFGDVSVDGVELPVAVKVIHDRNRANLGEWTNRWRRQSELIQSVDHPNIVKVRECFVGPEMHESGASVSSSRCLYLIMNWVRGVPLSEALARGLDPERRIGVLTGVASALDHLHSGRDTNGVAVIHRDIKPANVILDGETPRLVDFGFVRFGHSTGMTMVGTPGYMSPEVLNGQDATASSDRFSFGVLAYVVLTDQPPRPVDREVWRARLNAVPMLAGLERVSDAVVSLIDPDPSRRPHDLAVFSLLQRSSAFPETMTATGLAATRPPNGGAAALLNPTAASDATTLPNPATLRTPVPTPVPPPDSPMRATPATVRAARPDPPRGPLDTGRTSPGPGTARNRRRLIGAMFASTISLGLIAGLVSALIVSEPTPSPTTSTAAPPSTNPTTSTASTASTVSSSTIATTTDPPKQIPVPSNLVRLSLADLQNWASTNGIVVTVERLEDRPEPVDTVIQTIPGAGEPVSPGTPMLVRVASEFTKMPKIDGATFRLALEQIANAGLSGATLDLSPAGSYGSDDMVTDQTPEPGIRVDRRQVRIGLTMQRTPTTSTTTTTAAP